MKSKFDESRLMWEAFRSPEDDDMDFSMDDDMDEDFDDDDFGDDFDDDMGDEMVMEIEPVAPVESIGDEEMNEILNSELKKLAEYGKRLEDLCGKVEFDAWMVAKVVKASDYVSDVWHRLDAGADFANTGFDQASPEQDLGF
jgi:hypothetical protein